MKKEIITNNDPKSPISEVFRSLRTNMQYMGSKKKLSMILTSTVQGEGKSFVTANLAVTFAQAGKKTIIVDADMRRPRQHKLFELEVTLGLSNYLSGIDILGDNREIIADECIYKTDIENLSVIPAGNVPPNPSELLLSGKLKELISTLEEKYDVIIFDGAPCLLVTDATIIARRVNYTIIVAEQNFTKMEDLKEAQRRIKHVGGHIAGVVLNKVKISKKQYGNKYYYGSKNSYKSNRHSRSVLDNVFDNTIQEDYDSIDDVKEQNEEEVKDTTSKNKESKEVNFKQSETRSKESKEEKSKEKEIKFEVKESEDSSVKELIMDKEDYNKLSASKDKITEIINQINKLKEIQNN